MTYWYVAQLDRDMITGGYGQGIYLYTPNKRIIIEGISFIDDVLIVKNVSSGNGYTFTLEGEPDLNKFEEVTHAHWIAWQKQNGKDYGDDDIDFKPYALKSTRAIAQELELIKRDDYESLHHRVQE